jgi:hypothetical protein
VTDRKNGRILFDRPKPTVGCSASGRRRKLIENVKKISKLYIVGIEQCCPNSISAFIPRIENSFTPDN